MPPAYRAVLFVLLAVVAAGAVVSDGSPAKAADQPIGLWLPWEAGTSWRLTNGPHGTSTDAFGAALDFQPPDAAGRDCNGFTSSYWVVAAAGGRVHERPNGLEVDHGNGFRTGYLHLQEKQVTSGRVDAGDRLGKVSCCPEGESSFCWATAPHLHFYTVFRGAQQGIRGINLEGWVVQDDGCLAAAGERICPGGWLKSGAPAHAPANADVVLVLDATGDTNNGDPQRARHAVARAFLAASGPDDRVGIVTYNSIVHDTTHLRTANGKRGTDGTLLRIIDRLGADGRADLRVGVRAGCRELILGAQVETRAAVLVSDGVHDFRQMGDPQKCFKRHQWPVHTVAVAAGGEETLTRIAEETGGRFINLAGAQDIACEMYKLRMMIVEQAPGACTTGNALGERPVRIDFEVPAGQAEATFTATWLRLDAPSNMSGKARVEVTLISPSGREIRAETVRGDVSVEVRKMSASYTLVSPEAGVWSVRLLGLEAPVEGVPVTVSVRSSAARPAPAFIPPAADTEDTGQTTPPLEPDRPTESATGTPTPTPEATSGPSQSPTPRPSATPTARPTSTPDPQPSPTPEATPSQEPAPPPEPAPTSEAPP